MFKRQVACVFAMLFAQSANAFFDPPWITPAAPTSSESVSVNIRMGICDAIAERTGYPRITREGNTIHIVEYGHHWDDDELCIYDTGTTTEAIGLFPPGDYAVTVDLFYQDFFGEPQILNMGLAPFTVTGVPPARPVPAIGASGVLALLLLTLGLAMRALRTPACIQERSN